MENFKDKKDIIALISRMEADMLRVLRQYGYGEFTLIPVVKGTVDPNQKATITKKYDSPTKIVIEIAMSLNPESGKRLNDAVLVTDNTATMNSLLKSLVNKVRLDESGQEQPTGQY